MKLSTLNKDLVFHAPLSEERYNPATKRVDDLTPYENHGTAANAGVFVADRMGQIRAMSFNGTTDYVDCGNNDSLKIHDEITYSLWVKPRATQYLVGAYKILVSKDPVFNHGIFLQQSGQVFSGFRFVVGSGYTYTGSTADVWYHLAMVATTTSRKSYVNNVLVDSDTGIYTLTDDANPVRIGGGVAYRYSNCDLADVRIYNRVKTPAEITALYEAYHPKLSLGSPMAGLVLDMPLQSRYMKSATILTDRTPYSNDGVNSGATIGADYASFNGTSDNIRIADSESLSSINAMTAMCWVKGWEQNKYLFSHYDYGINQRSYYIASISTIMAIIISDDGIANVGHRKQYRSSITTFDNTWHLVGFSFDNGTLKLFVDGVEDANPTKTYDDPITTIHNSTADIMVGCYLNSDIPASFFAGNLAKLRMYNCALTNAEWLLRFEKEKGLFL